MNPARTQTAPAAITAPGPGRTSARFGTAALLSGGAILALVTLTALLAPWLAPGDPAALGPAADRLLPPSVAHPLGTDLLGRDTLARLVHGSRVSLLAGWISALVAIVLGTAVGLSAGGGPRWLDRLLMVVTDAFLSFPRIFLILLLVSLTRPSLTLTMLVIGLTGWMGVARLVRAETLSLARARVRGCRARAGPVAVAGRRRACAAVAGADGDRRDHPARGVGDPHRVVSVATWVWGRRNRRSAGAP